MQTLPCSYHSIFQTSGKIIHEEGVKSLWKGSVPTAIGMAAENAVAFGIHEALKRAFPSEQKDGEAPGLIQPFIHGTITGLTACIVLLPTEVIKAKTQVVIGDATKVTSTEIYRKMIQKQGYKSLFCGLDGQLARDGPFYGFFFGGYELFCYSFKTYFPEIPDEVNYFMSGGFAGMLAWTMTMPFDVPKTNVQASWDTKVVGSYFPEMARIVRERGVLALFNGLGPTLVRAFPANAALFLGVETGKKMFDHWIWKHDSSLDDARRR